MISRIWTIGHSTRKIDIFIALLTENGIKLVADVRMYPGSKRYPHFGREALAGSLSEAEIRYEHFPELGGRRKAKPNSKNTAWRNEMFRGYADYMETEDFQKGIARLVELENLRRRRRLELQNLIPALRADDRRHLSGLQPFDHLSDASLHITHKKEKIFRVGVRSTRAFDCLLRAAPAEELVEESHFARP